MVFPLWFSFGKGKPREDANIVILFYNLCRLPKRYVYTNEGSAGFSFLNTDHIFPRPYLP